MNLTSMQEVMNQQIKDNIRELVDKYVEKIRLELYQRFEKEVRYVAKIVECSDSIQVNLQILEQKTLKEGDK